MLGADPKRTFLGLLDAHLEGGPVTFETPRDRRVVGRRSNANESSGVVVHVRDERVYRRALTAGNLGMGEAFMDGDFVVEGGRLPELMTLLLRARLDKRIRGDLRAMARIAAIHLENRLRGDHSNVRAHYDLGDDLYEAFLDPTMTYSCGYAKDERADLETLQADKLARICDKLRLRGGERLLDIGCGYGGLLIHAASKCGITGVGISVSLHHAKTARARIAEAGLSDQLTVEVADHKALAASPRFGRFDKVVSVGMMEHLPRREYARYFDGIARVLAPGGLGLVHVIGCNGPSNDHDPFIQRYIFPGSGQPRLSEIATHLEKRELPILDVENMIRHYALTLRGWRERFLTNAPRLDQKRYDERFQRMWDYYLSCGIAAALASDGALYQVLFTNDCAAPIPLARV